MLLADDQLGCGRKAFGEIPDALHKVFGVIAGAMGYGGVDMRGHVEYVHR